MNALFRKAVEAIREDAAGVLHQLLDNNPELVKERLPVDGDSLLHLAVRRVRVDGDSINPVISVLLEYGADWNTPNTMGEETPKDLLLQIQAAPAISF